MHVTQYPSWLPATSARSFSAEGAGSQAAGLWPVHETPHRGSHRAHSPPLDSGATMHFLLTRDQSPGGRGGGRRKEGRKETVITITYHEAFKLLSHHMWIHCTFLLAASYTELRGSNSVKNSDGNREG